MFLCCSRWDWLTRNIGCGVVAGLRNIDFDVAGKADLDGFRNIGFGVVSEVVLTGLTKTGRIVVGGEVNT